MAEISNIELSFTRTPAAPGVGALYQFAFEIEHWHEIDPEQVKIRWKALMDLCKKHCEEQDDSEAYSDFHKVSHDSFKADFYLLSNGIINRKEFLSRVFSSGMNEDGKPKMEPESPDYTPAEIYKIKEGKRDKEAEQFAKTIYEKVVHEKGIVDCSDLRIPAGDTYKAVIEKLKHMKVDYGGGDIFYFIRE